MLAHAIVALARKVALGSFARDPRAKVSVEKAARQTKWLIRALMLATQCPASRGFPVGQL
eukprot:11406106-Alexandrium_andersonii.AAC.1